LWFFKNIFNPPCQKLINYRITKVYFDRITVNIPADESMFKSMFIYNKASLKKLVLKKVCPFKIPGTGKSWKGGDIMKNPAFYRPGFSKGDGS